MLFPFGPFGKTVCFRGQGPGNKEAKYVKLWVTDNNMVVATVVYVALPYLEICDWWEKRFARNHLLVDTGVYYIFIAENYYWPTISTKYLARILNGIFSQALNMVIKKSVIYKYIFVLIENVWNDPCEASDR